jgi:hypothetical protein
MLQKIKILFILTCIACSLQAQTLRTGAEQTEKLIPLLNNKRVALVVNQTSIVGQAQTHLLDTLIALGVDEVTASEDACRIEHVISQKTFEKIREHVARLTENVE